MTLTTPETVEASITTTIRESANGLYAYAISTSSETERCVVTNEGGEQITFASRAEAETWLADQDEIEAAEAAELAAQEAEHTAR